MARFSDEEIRRHGRQMALAEIGGRGQERLRAQRLRAGCALEALYLAGAGVSGLVVADAATAADVRALAPACEVIVDATAALPMNAEAATRAAAAQLWRVVRA